MTEFNLQFACERELVYILKKLRKLGKIRVWKELEITILPNPASVKRSRKIRCKMMTRKLHCSKCQTPTMSYPGSLKYIKVYAEVE